MKKKALRKEFHEKVENRNNELANQYDVAIITELQEKNKNLTEALSKVCKVSMKCLDGDAPIQELQEAISEANDTIVGNSVNLIDFPSYVKRKHSDFPVFCKQVIDIYNEWNK